MEDDQEEPDQKRIMVVDERESCLAQFVPENKFETIWSDSESKGDDEIQKIETEEDNVTLGCLDAALESKNVKLLQSPVILSKKLDDMFNQLAADTTRVKLVKVYLRTAFEYSAASCIALTQFLILILSSKWSWNFFAMVCKISFSMLTYLTLACSTVLVAVILNFYDQNNHNGDNDKFFNISEKEINAIEYKRSLKRLESRMSAELKPSTSRMTHARQFSTTNLLKLGTYQN